MSARWLPLAGLVLVVVAARPKAVQAQAAFGVQASLGSDTDVGLGGRIVSNLERFNLDAVGSFILFFPDDKEGRDRDAWELNGNLFYHIRLKDVHSILPYIGGGLNIAHREVGSGGDTEIGLNLGGGVRFLTLSNITPFVELRGVTASDFDQVVLSGGFLFGPLGR